MKNLSLPSTLTLFISVLFSISLSAQWTPLNSQLEAPNQAVASLSVVDKSTVWAYAGHLTHDRPNFRLTRTTNGGKIWRPTTMHGIYPKLLITQLFALNDQVAWVATTDALEPATGHLYKTYDGGNNWHRQGSAFNRRNEVPCAVHFFNTRQGVALGFKNKPDAHHHLVIYTTQNGGEVWEKIGPHKLPTPLKNEGIRPVSSDGFYEVRGNHIWFATDKNRVYHSADRGQSWEAQSTPIRSKTGITSLAFKNEKLGLAIAANPYQLIKTTDGGQTWHQVLAPAANATRRNPSPTEIQYIPGTEGTFIIHDGSSGNEPVLQITRDAGKNWELLKTPVNLWTLRFLDAKTGFAGGPIQGPGQSGLYRWSGPSLSKRIYVDRDARGCNNGSTWQNAYTDLQTALSSARAKDEIWVAEGIYHPAGPNGDRQTSFIINKDLTILGGFAGTENSATDRDPDMHLSILSGDLNNNDVKNVFGKNRSDNSRTVMVIEKSVTESTLLDGFVISSGHAHTSLQGEDIDMYGGGLFCAGNPLIRNCHFTQNYARLKGGALFIAPGSSGIRIDQCQFTHNEANAGGGIFAAETNISIKNCLFSDNRTHAEHYEAHGGGLNLGNTSGTVRQCTFQNNRAIASGGGLIAWNKHWDQKIQLEVIDCEFLNNQASENGGGLQFILKGSKGDYAVRNCRFRKNTTGGVGTVALHGIGQGSLSITDCMITENEATYSAGLDIGSLPQSGFFEYSVLRCHISKNTARRIGGGLSLSAESAAHFKVEETTISHNSAISRGAGVVVAINHPEVSIEFNNSKIRQNYSPKGSGLDVFPLTQSPGITTRAKVDFNNCLFARNFAKTSVINVEKTGRVTFRNLGIVDNRGPALVVDRDASLVLQNTILANPNFREFQRIIETGTVRSMGGNLILDTSFNEFSSPSDLSLTDPGFEGPGIYFPAAKSPLVNAGVNTNVYTPFDLAGQPRIQQEQIDIGPYESNFTTTTVRDITVRKLQVRPNPASNEVFLELPETITASMPIDLIHISGQYIRTINYTPSQEVSLTDLPAGHYLLRSRGKDIHYVWRFTKL